MGFISNLANATKEAFPGTSRGQALWREVFGQTDKEREKPISRPPPAGNGWGRSGIASPEAFKRLLDAMRSMAPGGWSDDRWEQTKHFTGIAYVAIHRICTQLQQAEFQVFIKDKNHPDGKRPVNPDDPPHGDRQIKPYKLVEVLEKPNRQDSFGKMMYRWGQQKRLTGTALTWMVPNMLGVPMELYCIPTAIAIPQPAINPDYPDGYYRIQPLYPYGPFSSYPTPATAVGAPVPAQWMLRFQYPHPLLRYDGYSPMTGMRLHIDETESIDRSRWYKMKRSTNPSAVLNMKDMEGAQPLPETELERIHAEWENEYQGPENTGKLIVAPPGGELAEWGSKPVDMEYQAGWDQLTSFVLGGGFGITKPAAGMVEETSYSNLWACIKQLNLVTLDPECDDTAADLTRHLAPFFGDDLIVEIRTKRIDDHDVRNAMIDKLIAAKAITKNEVRKKLEMPLTKEEWGEEIAGFEKPPEQPGMPGMPGQEGAIPGQEGQQMTEEELAGRPTPPEIEKDRGSPGNLSAGSLGPRKRIFQYQSKSIYDRVREVISNGHG